MRPVRLDMHGFAAFREPTTVDFTGADYFALVGPTGSGKSTVIDAMTFALYGSVPRWDDRRMVRLALSPTANRGTVRLLFDIGADRYVVARELRRSASGSVTVRNARLERLLDAKALGELDDDTEPIAADGAVTKAVEDLLGLPFEQFRVCVVLPQGEFAKFLHAKPSERQQTLTQILGMTIYQDMAKAAGAEAKEQAQRAEWLAKELADYADATEQAATEAAERHAALTALLDRVHRRLPELAAAEAEVTQAERAAEQLRAERDLLAGVRAPTGVAELAARARDVDAALARARERCTAAEAADTTARERLAAAPSAEPLAQLRRDHAELAQLRARLPELVGRAEQASERARAANTASTQAAGVLEQARADWERAKASVDAVRAEANRYADEHEALAALRIPAGVAELAADRRSAAERVARARRRLVDAESADTQARDALAGAPDRGVLVAARRDHGALASAERNHTAVAAKLAEASAQLAEADAALADAEQALAEAMAERAARGRADLVAALRPTLAVHQPCPVCEQPVHQLPPPAEAAGVTEADRAVDEATARRDRAQAARHRAAEAEHRARVELDGVTGRIDQLRAALAETATAVRVDVLDASEVDRRLAELDRLAEAAKHADDQFRRARRERDEAEAADAEAVERLRGAADELRAARDPVVSLGAPPVDQDDLARSWRVLADWAAKQAAERAERLTEARRRVAEAEDTLAKVERAGHAAADAARRARAAETDAVRAEQDAQSELTRARRRADELTAALADAPSDDELSRQLAELTALAEQARQADAALRAARRELAETVTVAEKLATEVEAGWRQLAEARDPLVGLGAPPLSRVLADSGRGVPSEGAVRSERRDASSAGEALLAGWAELTDWAARAAAERARRLSDAETAVAATRAARDAAERVLAEDLAAHQVPVPTDQPLRAVAAPAASAAAERAKAEVERIAQRRAKAAQLAADRAGADEAAQVAALLAKLLRSDEFPRWLVSSALDTLVTDASRVLAELSGGQFELTHADGEFLVVDHADADARRPVKTLSGGETFQASLALALALAEQLRTLAAAGAARVDSLFLDEGFGTLDEANLETVAGTLENLAAWGDRMVGVVTHVPALAERVPVRFTVRRDQRTASIIREGGS